MTARRKKTRRKTGNQLVNAIERGVLLRPLGNVLYALPPACLTEDEARKVAETMRALVELAGELAD